jgi:hypothetical protein
MNAALQDLVPPRRSTSNLAEASVRILAKSVNSTQPDSADRSGLPKGRSESVRVGVAVLAVIGAATLWGWAIMQLCGLFLQAASLMLRSAFPLS